MNIISIKIAEKEFKSIKKYLHDYEIINENKNILSVFKYKNSTITVFNSFKMTIQSKSAQDVYGELISNKIISDNNLVLTNNKSCECDQYQINTIGCDEVGVGDFFGGLVTTACYVKKEDIDYLINIGVKDSKKLSDKKMNELFPLIIKKVRYASIYINPKEYNEYYQKYNNSHIIKTLLHNKALIKLKSEINNNDEYCIIMDEYCSSENYQKYLKAIKPNEIVDIDVFKTKAETHYIAVACASIIARIYFLKQIEILNNEIKQYDLNIPLGNNEQVQNVASKIYNKNNKILDNLVKKHFITYNKIIGEDHE